MTECIPLIERERDLNNKTNKREKFNMPYMTDGKRDYAKEYKKYHSRPDVKKRRAANNKANRDMNTYGNGDGKDVAHKDNNTKNSSKANLKLQSPRKNRSVPRTKAGRRKK